MKKKTYPSNRFFIGLRNALPISILLWAIIFMVCCHGCAYIENNYVNPCYDQCPDQQCYCQQYGPCSNGGEQ